MLAELDKTPLQTQVQQAEASLDDAKSEVVFQTATYERYKALLDKKLVAQADYDQVKYNYDKARANLKTAQAGYDKSMVNLNYASIYSPISWRYFEPGGRSGSDSCCQFQYSQSFYYWQ